MENTVHLNVFDFDETLFRVPGFTSSEAKGKEPYEWYDSPESLDPKFNIRGIANVIERTKDDCLNYLVTHRVQATQARVIDILAEHKIRFNKTYFLGRNSKKADTVLELMRETDADTGTIFEDSLWEIIQYTAYFLDAGITQSVDFFFVDKSKIIKIDWESARTLEELVEVERLRLL